MKIPPFTLRVEMLPPCPTCGRRPPRTIDASNGCQMCVATTVMLHAVHLFHVHRIRDILK